MDYEGGNNNYGGTSFALLAQGTDGAITSTTFSSATASFPNDGSLINQYLSIFNGTLYAVYRVTAWVSSTSLTIAAISGGTALANQTARQYYIGGRWKSTTGATAVRTVPGDTIRIMASPNPTSIGSATWTGGGRPIAVNIASSTNATPIAVTTSAAHNLAAGNYVAIASHATNSNANGVWKVGSVLSSTQFTIVQIDGTNTTGNGVGGATGTVSNVTNCMVETASPLVQNVALCGGGAQKPAWTAATANVTTAQNTTVFKEGYFSASIAINATFTTGKAAYYTLPATLDLSSYQQISFWVTQSLGTIGAAGATYLALCSDTLGDTVVHTCNIPPLGALNTWSPVTVDFGTNLSTTIRSVAFYVVTDNAAQTFLLDNIIACKASSSADSITLRSLISKSDGTGDEAWYAIQSINYDSIMLANQNSLEPTNVGVRGYNGTTETVTTYKREAFRVGATALVGTTVFGPAEAGTISAPIAYSGGWDRTNMSSQSGQTWYDGVNGNGVGWLLNLTYTSVDRINFVRCSTGVSVSIGTATVGSIYAPSSSNAGVLASGQNAAITSIWANNCATGVSISNTGITITDVKNAENCNVSGVSFTSGSASVVVGSIKSGNVNNTTGGGLSISGSTFCSIGTYTSSGIGFNSIYIGQSGCNNFYINGGSTAGATSAGISMATTALGLLNLNNFTINETTEVSTASTGNLITVFSNRHDNTDGNNWQFQASTGTINQQTTVVDSPATTSWKMSPTSANARATAPLRLKLGTVVCAAGSLVTVTARMRRGNTGLTMRLVCPGGQISGVSSDVTSDMTAAANTWETVTITFTPTKAGGVDVYAYAFGGTTFSGYVCNLTASQA